MPDLYWDSKTDPYVYPGTRVLKNLANIEDEEKLEAFEEQVTALRLEEAMTAIKDAPINLKTWQKLHRTLFQDVYDWSGDIRTVHLAKGNSVFALPQTIEPQAKDFLMLSKRKILQIWTKKNSSRAWLITSLN